MCLTPRLRKMAAALCPLTAPKSHLFFKKNISYKRECSYLYVDVFRRDQIAMRLSNTSLTLPLAESCSDSGNYIQ